MNIESSSESQPDHSGYHRAAALLARFDPERLKPASSSSSKDFDQLLADCTVVDGALGSAKWALRQDVRQEILRELPRLLWSSARDVNRESGAVPAGDLVQEQLDAYAFGRPQPLSAQSKDRLEATARIFEWADGVLESLPTRDELTAALQRVRLLAPFRYMTSHGFIGREEELETLRNYVEFRDAHTLIGMGGRVVRSTLGLQRQRPLVLHGAGGTGKSTLLSQFILEHLEGRETIAFAYLDLDRAELQVDEPMTLLAEAAVQIGLQIPGRREAGLRLKQDLLADVHNRRQERNSARQFQTSFGEVLDSAERVFSLLDEEHANRPVLIVLDTFEQAQYRSPKVLEGLWQLFEDMQARFPLLRIVLSGRASLRHIKNIPHDSIPLQELDPQSAFELLTKHGVRDPRLADQLVSKLGGNPLVLRLAAGLAIQDSKDALSDLPTRKYFLLRTDARVIQGVLYRRFLGHLEGSDPRLSKLAHPGLTLRVITADIVQKVLAGPCDLGDLTETEAKKLVNALAKNVWIVSEDEPGTLRHRADLRSVMLRLLERDMPQRFRQICEKAVQYYADRTSPPDRAEEIYHRILLGEPPATLQHLWSPAVEPFLYSALDDLYDVRRQTLELLLEGEASSPSALHLDLETKVALAEREAARLLDLDRPRDALETLDRDGLAHSTHGRTLRARALLAIGKPDAAYLELADRASNDTEDIESAETLLDFLLVRTRAMNLAPAAARKLSTGELLDDFELIAALQPPDTKRLLELGLEILFAATNRHRANNAKARIVQLEVSWMMMDIWERAAEPTPGGSVALAWRLVGALVSEHSARVVQMVGSANLAQRHAHNIIAAGPGGDPPLSTRCVPGISLFTDFFDRLLDEMPDLADAKEVVRTSPEIDSNQLLVRAQALDIAIGRLAHAEENIRKEVAAAAIRVPDSHSAISLRFAMGIRGSVRDTSSIASAIADIPCVYLIPEESGVTSHVREVGKLSLRYPSALVAGDAILIQAASGKHSWASVESVQNRSSRQIIHYTDRREVLAELPREMFTWVGLANRLLDHEAMAHELSVADVIEFVRQTSSWGSAPPWLKPLLSLVDIPDEIARPTSTSILPSFLRLKSSRKPLA